MADKQVPLDPILPDKLVAFKPEPTDLIESPQMMHQKIKEQLIKDPSKVSKEDEHFFLEYFEKNIVEDDFEIATKAQKILGK